jgi:hypothetical protein
LRPFALARATILSGLLFFQILDTAAQAQNRQQPSSQSGAAPEDPLVGEILDSSKANRERSVGLFCRQIVRDAQYGDQFMDRTAEAREAERLCIRCKLVDGLKYTEWNETYARRRAAQIREAQKKCLDRSLSQAEVNQCRRRLEQEWLNW